MNDWRCAYKIVSADRRGTVACGRPAPFMCLVEGYENPSEAHGEERCEEHAITSEVIETWTRKEWDE